jgi:hypothetical protein
MGSKVEVTFGDRQKERDQTLGSYFTINGEKMLVAAGFCLISRSDAPKTGTCTTQILERYQLRFALSNCNLCNGSFNNYTVGHP